MRVIPADASTVILLRPCSDTSTRDIEVLMVRRNNKSSFVPGYYVFPGGVVDDEDCDTEISQFVRGLDCAGASKILSDMRQPQRALGAWIAGIRETFEETGILLACHKEGPPVTLNTDEKRQRFASYREALIERKILFTEMLKKEALVLPLDKLHYFSHWITPEFLPLRYDVRFFVASAPTGQTVSHDSVELTGHVWIRPMEAIKQYERGKLDMVLPQIMTLEELKHFRTVADVMAAAYKRNIPATLTKIKRIDGRDVEVMPDGSGYESRPPVYAWPDKGD